MVLTRDINTTGVAPGSEANATALAEGIVQQNQSAINRFVGVQRQQIEISDKAVHRAVLALDGMNVYYTNVQGLERMHYNIRPEAEARPPPEELPPVERLPAPEVPELPEVPEAKVPEPWIPEPVIPEPPKVPEPPELPEVPELNVDVEPEYYVVMPITKGLAVEFGDHDQDAPKHAPGVP